MKKKFWSALAIILCVMIFAVGMTACSDNLGAKVGEVTIAIECKTILQNMDKAEPGLIDNKLIHSDGIILKDSAVDIFEKDNVLTVLKRICKQNKIHIDADSSYVKAINHIYEMSVGESSGWLYFVDGLQPNVGANQYKLKGGEKIVFAYTCVVGDLK